MFQNTKTPTHLKLIHCLALFALCLLSHLKAADLSLERRIEREAWEVKLVPAKSVAIEDTQQNNQEISKQEESLEVENQDNLLEDEEDPILAAERKRREAQDPYSSYNRSMTNFNLKLLYFISPASTWYSTETPNAYRKALTNHVQNLTEPFNFLYSLLQLKIDVALTALSRFFINSTVGILGFVDVASEMGVKYELEDLDNVLATYGVPDGPPIVLPFYSFHSVRSAVARIAELSIFTLKLYPEAKDLLINPENTGVDYGDYAAIYRFAHTSLLTAYNAEQSLKLNPGTDDYTFIRDAFLDIRYKSESDEDLDDLENDLLDSLEIE